MDVKLKTHALFQGRIREEVVYGICLPISGFSALFVIVSLSAVVSALVAVAMVHRLQAQRELVRNARKNLPASLVASLGWAQRIQRPERNGAHPHQHPQQQQPQFGWLRAYGLFRGRCAPAGETIVRRSSVDARSNAD